MTHDEQRQEERERVGAFLRELIALSRKHNIWIDGCGCCGSPYLTFGDDPQWRHFPEIETGPDGVDRLTRDPVDHTDRIYFVRPPTRKSDRVYDELTPWAPAERSPPSDNHLVPKELNGGA